MIRRLHEVRCLALTVAQLPRWRRDVQARGYLALEIVGIEGGPRSVRDIIDARSREMARAIGPYTQARTGSPHILLPIQPAISC